MKPRRRSRPARCLPTRKSTVCRRIRASLPLIHDPGAHWNYNSAGSVLIADALSRAIVANPQSAEDRRQRMRAWMDEVLFAPIGMAPGREG